MTAIKVNTWGLLAAAPVKWLLSNEPQVEQEVRKFIRGERDGNTIDVAAPPSWAEMIQARAKGRAIKLPVVRLSLRKVMDHIKGPHVEVTCSDDDMEVIVDMARAKNEAFKQETLAALKIDASG